MSSMRGPGAFVCREIARAQSGQVSDSMSRKLRREIVSRSTMAVRCTQEQVFKFSPEDALA